MSTVYQRVKSCVPHSHTQNTPQPCYQSTKLLNIIGSMKTEVLYKFGASKTKGVEIKIIKCVHSTEHVKSCHSLTNRTHLNYVVSQPNS